MGSSISDADLTHEKKRKIYQIILEEVRRTGDHKLIKALDKFPFNEDHFRIWNNGLYFSQIAVSPYRDPMTIDEMQRNWIDEIYNLLSVDRKHDHGVFYHFKKANRLKEILTESKLHLTTLEDQSNNDYSELIEYHKRYGTHDWGFQFRTNKSRQENFIACFTKSFRNKRFWKEYTDNFKGGCVGIRFTNFCKDFVFKDSYEFRDVYYDNGYDFDFFNEIRFRIFKECNLDFQFTPSFADWFPSFYKRKRYEWEDESRLLMNLYRPSAYVKRHELTTKFDPTKHEVIDHFSQAPDARYRDYVTLASLCKIEDYIVKPGGKTILKIPFDNPYFSCNVTEIILGPEMEQSDETELQSLAAKLNVPVWKISNHHFRQISDYSAQSSS